MHPIIVSNISIYQRAVPASNPHEKLFTTYYNKINSVQNTLFKRIKEMFYIKRGGE